MTSEAVAKKAVKEPESQYTTAVAFKGKQFGKLVGIWLFGGIVSIIPSFFIFLRKPVETFNYIEFFSDIEILYTCVTLTVVVISNLILVRSPSWVTLSNLLFVMIGSMLYIALKLGVEFPILSQGDTFSFVNLFFFILVVFINILSYITLCIQRSVKQ